MSKHVQKVEESIIDKIKACFRHAYTNANEHEAAVALSMAKKLMAKHRLTEGEVNWKSEDKKNIVEKGNLKHYKILEDWEITVSSVCEHIFNVKTLLGHEREFTKGWVPVNRTVLRFIGFETDVAVAREAFTWLRKAILKISRTREGGRDDRLGFLTGCADRLLLRAVEASRDLNKEDDKKCRDLVVQRDADVKNYMGKIYPEIKETTRGAQGQGNKGYEDGVDAGEKIDLNFRKGIKNEG